MRTTEQEGAGAPGAARNDAIPRSERKPRAQWVHRWKDDVAAEPELPGVWRRRDGGYHVRGRVTDPRTGKMREVPAARGNRELPAIARARDAFAWLQGELDRIRSGVIADGPSAAPQFHAFAANVFERKVLLGKIRSAAGRGEVGVDPRTPPGGRVRRPLRRSSHPGRHQGMAGKIAARINAGEMAPASANTILGVLRQITDEAVDDFDIRDPMRGIDSFDNREHSTYTEEEPNSLSPKDVARFLGKLRELHPEHYAFTFLGITTGLRPSSLRPLRREGTAADVKWTEGLLIIRRSQTLGEEVMETTKTDLHQRLTLPKELLDVLKWHVAEVLLPFKMRHSELLFPSVLGGYRSRSCLDKPFDAVCKAIKLGYRFTPRGMRRTYQDLARAAGVHDAVTRAISGHATPAMQLHYSTARGGEVKQALAKVANIATGAKVIDIGAAR